MGVVVGLHAKAKGVISRKGRQNSVRGTDLIKWGRRLEDAQSRTRAKTRSSARGQKLSIPCRRFGLLLIGCVRLAGRDMRQPLHSKSWCDIGMP